MYDLLFCIFNGSTILGEPFFMYRIPSELNNQLKLKNNDPLAHVDLFLSGSGLESGDEYRMYIEYVTDMGERLAQPFRKTFEYTTKGDDFVSDTGLLYLQFLENGYLAAVNDVEQGNFARYHADRAEAFYSQHPQIRAWAADATDSSFKLYASLCPPNSELEYEEAKRQSFKPDRLMASMQLYEKTESGIKLHAFSLDGLSLTRLGELYGALGADEAPARSTLEQLTKPLTITAEVPADNIVDRIIDEYDRILSVQTGGRYMQGLDEQKFRAEANSFVESKPETYDMYRQTVIEVARSLESGYVSAKLGAIVAGLEASILVQNAHVPDGLRVDAGQHFDRNGASTIIEYLRTRAIPHYLTSRLDSAFDTSDEQTDYSGAYQDISDAGGQATAQDKSYEGDCPTSGASVSAQSEISALSQIFNLPGWQSREEWQWKTGKCVVDNCPTRPSKTTIGPCSVCVGCQSIFDTGKNPKQVYKNNQKSFSEIFSVLFSNEDSNLAA